MMTQPGSLLIVDDEEMNRDMLSQPSSSMAMRS